jgi:hypothetical protein
MMRWNRVRLPCDLPSLQSADETQVTTLGSRQLAGSFPPTGLVAVAMGLAMMSSKQWRR